MRKDDIADDPDPAEVQPTDNSAGNPVDLQRVDEVTEEEQPPPQQP